MCEVMRKCSSQDLGFKKLVTKVWMWMTGWERVGVVYVGFGLQGPGIQIRKQGECIIQGGSHVYSQPDSKATVPKVLSLRGLSPNLRSLPPKEYQDANLGILF